MVALSIIAVVFLGLSGSIGCTPLLATTPMEEDSWLPSPILPPLNGEEDKKQTEAKRKRFDEKDIKDAEESDAFHSSNALLIKDEKKQNNKRRRLQKEELEHSEESARENLNKALEHLRNHSKNITDNHITALLWNVTQNSKASITAYDQARLTLALMRYDGRYAGATDEQAYEWLTQASDNPLLCKKDCIKADLFRALMRYHNRTNAIDDSAAVALLRKVSESRGAPAERRAEAMIFLALMRYDNRTDTLTDNEAANLLQQARQTPGASLVLRADADLNFALFYLHNRIQLVNPEKIIENLSLYVANHQLPCDRRIEISDTITHLLKKCAQLKNPSQRDERNRRGEREIRGI